MIHNNPIDCRADIYSLGIILKYGFPKSYKKIANKCSQQDREKRFSSVNDIKKALKNKKIKNISIISSLIFALIFITSFFAIKHYSSQEKYNIKEKEILEDATQYIDSKIKFIKDEIEKGPTSEVYKYNELNKNYHDLTNIDFNKWIDKIPTDIPFHNDFIKHWNTYIGNNIKDIIVLYTDWKRESFQLIFDNLKPGEEIVADSENPILLTPTVGSDN